MSDEALIQWARDTFAQVLGSRRFVKGVRRERYPSERIVVVSVPPKHRTAATGIAQLMRSELARFEPSAGIVVE